MYSKMQQKKLALSAHDNANLTESLRINGAYVHTQLLDESIVMR